MKKIISSLNHPLVKHFVSLRKDSSYRKEKQSLLILGDTLIQELSISLYPKELLSKENTTEDVLRKISGMSTFSESIAEFALPLPSSLQNLSSLLVLDGLADPGNVGNLLRSAVAFGFGGVFFLPGCVDPFNDKVVRASRAALFTLPWKEGSFEDLVQLSASFTPLVADLGGKDIAKIAKPTAPLLVLSHEKQGVSPKMQRFGEKVTIPMKTMESLNVAVAGAILMYVLRS